MGSTSESMLMTKSYQNQQIHSWGVRLKEPIWHMTCCKVYKSTSEKNPSGPAYLDGKTLSSQLDDMVEPISIHFHWVIRNCEEDREKLNSVLPNIVEHYKIKSSSLSWIIKGQKINYELILKFKKCYNKSKSGEIVERCHRKFCYI